MEPGGLASADGVPCARCLRSRSGRGLVPSANGSSWAWVPPPSASMVWPSWWTASASASAPSPPTSVVVLGARVLPGGVPSGALRRAWRRRWSCTSGALRPGSSSPAAWASTRPPRPGSCAALAVRLGVPAEACVLEEQSHSTEQNARYTAELLRYLGARRVVVVSDPYHLLRARQYFRLQGFEVATSPALLTERNLQPWTASTGPCARPPRCSSTRACSSPASPPDTGLAIKRFGGKKTEGAPPPSNPGEPSRGPAGRLRRPCPGSLPIPWSGSPSTSSTTSKPWGWRVRRKLGLARPPRILPYLRLWDGPASPSSRRACWRTGMCARLGGADAAGQRHRLVEALQHGGDSRRPRPVAWGDNRWEGPTDEEGFLELWVEPPPGAKAGWHEVHLHLLAHAPGARTRVRAPVLLAGAQPVRRHQRRRRHRHRDRGQQLPQARLGAVPHRPPPARALRGRERLRRRPAGGAATRTLIQPHLLRLQQPVESLRAPGRVPRRERDPRRTPAAARLGALGLRGFAPGGGHSHKLDKYPRGDGHARRPCPSCSSATAGRRTPSTTRCTWREYPWPRALHLHPQRMARTQQLAQALALTQLAAEVRANGSELLVVKDTVPLDATPLQPGVDTLGRGLRRAGPPGGRTSEARSLLDKLDREHG